MFVRSQPVRVFSRVLFAEQCTSNLSEMESESFFTSLAAVWTAVALATVYLLYRYGTSSFDYFERQGITGPKPIPFIGNVWGIWRENLPKYDMELVKKYGKRLGYFDGTLPNLWTTDLEVIKHVFVKNFDHFVNRRGIPITTKVMRKMVSIMQDQEWKDVRSSITPAFTTGKIKKMSVMITDCANRLSSKFEQIALTHGKIDAKMEFSAFTMDVIARCALGMQINSLGKEDDPFMAKAKKVFSSPTNKSPTIIFFFAFPFVMKLFGERLFLTEEFQFFIKTLEDVLKERKNSKETYNDFIEMATETIGEFTKDVNGKKIPMWNTEDVDEIVAAQAVVFLLAGFDTTATTLTNTVFLLARYPDVQQQLYEKVKEKIGEAEGVTHELVLDFPYVDHVIHETLRMYPPLPRIERTCTKDITHNGIHFKKGMIVTVPTFPLHYDKDYYPEPERFNPDRWNSDNPNKPHPNAFMPFGMGPRNCIGMRFAMEEMKIALCTLINHFRFFPVAETPVTTIPFLELVLANLFPFNRKKWNLRMAS